MIKLKLKNKLILILATVILFSGFIATILVYNYAKKSVLDIKKDDLKIITEQKAEKLENIFQNSQSIARNLAKEERLALYLEDSPKLQNEDILGILKAYNIDDSFSAIYLLNEKGEALVSTDETFIGKNYGFRDYFIEAMAGNDWTDVSIGVTSKKPGYYFSTPIKNEKNESVGVLVLKMIPEKIHQSIINDITSTKGHLMFSDYDGIVLYSDEENRIFKSLGQLSDKKLTLINKKKRYDGIEISPLQYDLVMDYLYLQNKTSLIEMKDEEDNQDEIIIISKIGTFPFYIIVEESNATFLSVVYNITIYLMAYILLSVIFSLLIVYVLVNKYLEPLTKIKSAIEDIEKNKNFKLEIKTGDEFEDLSKVFNKMYHKLNKSKQNIEKEIKKRTIDLEKINSYMVGRETKMIELKKKIKELENNETKS